jgi:hypothetical protein
MDGNICLFEVYVVFNIPCGCSVSATAIKGAMLRMLEPSPGTCNHRRAHYRVGTRHVSLSNHRMDLCFFQQWDGPMKRRHQRRMDSFQRWERPWLGSVHFRQKGPRRQRDWCSWHGRALVLACWGQSLMQQMAVERRPMQTTFDSLASSLHADLPGHFSTTSLLVVRRLSVFRHYKICLPPRVLPRTHPQWHR